MNSYNGNQVEQNFQIANANYRNYRILLRQQQLSANMTHQQIQPNYQDLYQQAIQARNQAIKERDEYYEKMFKENFPKKIASILSAAIILISLVEIVLQIVLIVENAPLSFVGSGIWGGLYGFITAGIILATSKQSILFYFIILK